MPPCELLRKCSHFFSKVSDKNLFCLLLKSKNLTIRFVIDLQRFDEQLFWQYASVLKRQSFCSHLSYVYVIILSFCVLEKVLIYLYSFDLPLDSFSCNFTVRLFSLIVILASNFSLFRSSMYLVGHCSMFFTFFFLLLCK